MANSILESTLNLTNYPNVTSNLTPNVTPNVTSDLDYSMGSTSGEEYLLMQKVQMVLGTVGTVGNFLLVHCFFRKKPKHPSDYFILAFSITDLGQSVFFIITSEDFEFLKKSTCFEID